MTFAGNCESGFSSFESQDVNVGDTERLVSVVGGGLLLASLVRYGSLPGMLCTLLGAGLVYRGLTGHCHLYEALEMNSNTDSDDNGGLEELQDRSYHRSTIDLASSESFPASDPPAWTGAVT